MEKAQRDEIPAIIDGKAIDRAVDCHRSPARVDQFGAAGRCGWRGISAPKRESGYGCEQGGDQHKNGEGRTRDFGPWRVGRGYGQFLFGTRESVGILS